MNNFFTVLKKELTVVFRDKKSILFTLLVPLILYPAMFAFMNSMTSKPIEELEKEINIAIEGDTTSSIAETLKGIPSIKVSDTKDSTQALKEGDIQLIIKIPDNFDTPVDNKTPEIELLYDEGSQKSQIASSMIDDILNQYKTSLVEGSLTALGVDSNILTPFSSIKKSGLNPEDTNPMAALMLGMIPSLLVICIIGSTTGMAADLGAAEKERCTFEPLLSTSAKRNSILWGKISSMCIFALLYLVLNMGAMIFSINKFMNNGGELKLELTPTTTALTFIIVFLTLIAYCSLQMSISIFARSSKEANTYLGALIMPSMLLCYIPMMMDAGTLNQLFFHVPILNTVCATKELMSGLFNTQHLITVLAWNVVYIIASTLFAKYMFSKEEVVFRN